MSSGERAVFELEIARNTNNPQLTRYIGDSLLVDKDVLPNYTIDKLINMGLSSKSLVKEEVGEIFGTKPAESFQLKHTTLKWQTRNFKKTIVKLYSDNDKNQNLNFFGLLSISVPVIRKDKKYAIVQVENIQEGGLLRVYKKTPKGWVFYKTINLYVT